jgi:hypothetical protein
MLISGANFTKTDHLVIKIHGRTDKRRYTYIFTYTLRVMDMASYCHV